MRNRVCLALICAAALACPVVQAPSANARPQAAQAQDVRLLPLEGGRNFRDLGGYRAADGRTVKWGMLYRSGSMHGLTDKDYAELQRRGVVVVCDLRDRRERAAEPVNWPAKWSPRVLSDDYDLDLRFLPSGSPASWTPDQMRAAMIDSYPRMLAQFNGQYRRMFGELLAGHAPLAFNCSAGKDRTGIGAALLLTALGVPRETVIEDYLLTNRYLNAASLVAKDGKPNPANPLGALPPELMKPLLAADTRYIQAALAVVDSHKDGVDGYLRDELGLDRAQLIELRNRYLMRS